MRLTTKGRFAVTAILDLAHASQKGGPVSLAGISERQGISLSYLEQLFGKLRRNELVSSVRGPGGGYLLAKKPRGRVTGGGHHPRGRRSRSTPTPCGGKENCHDDQRCMTHDLWAGLNATVHGFLSRVSLAQLVEKQRTKPVSVAAPRTRSARGRPDHHRLIPLLPHATPMTDRNYPIYLDYSATTPVDPRVAGKMIPWLTEHFGNPASRSHAYGWEAEEAVENARAEVASLVNCDAKRRIVWTSGATGVPTTSRLKGAAHFYAAKGKHIVTVKTEHKAVLDTVRELERVGFSATYLEPGAGRPRRPREVPRRRCAPTPSSLPS